MQARVLGQRLPRPPFGAITSSTDAPTPKNRDQGPRERGFSLLESRAESTAECSRERREKVRDALSDEAKLEENHFYAARRSRNDNGRGR